MRTTIALAAAASLLATIATPAHGVQAGPCDFPIQKRKPMHVKRGQIPPLAIGDSTMIWAVPLLAKSGFEVNARLCRPFSEGIEMMKQRKKHHRLPQFVVLALGASSPVRDIDVDRALKVLGPTRVLGLPTHRFFRGQDGPDTATIRREAKLHPNRIELIDWVRDSKGHPGWFSYDGLHPNLVGAKHYARVITRAWRVVQSRSSKSRLRAPHTGQNQSSGMSAKSVPGGTPPSGSPSAGS